MEVYQYQLMIRKLCWFINIWLVFGLRNPECLTSLSSRQQD